MDDKDLERIFEAASVEEALKQAAEEFGLLAGELEAEILSEEKSFFGLFGKKLRVQVKPKKIASSVSSVSSVPDVETDDAAICDFLADVLEKMGLHTEVEVREADHMITIEGQDANILVGRYGDGLKAMEYLVNLAMRTKGNSPRIRLDSGGYRERRRQSLERLAETSARKVVQRGDPLRLEPMASWERWVIHTALKDNPDVDTHSVGESPDRKVVITLKGSSVDRAEGGSERRNHSYRSHYRR